MTFGTIPAGYALVPRCPVCGYSGMQPRAHWAFCPERPGGPARLGYCDGCETRTLQPVRTVTGEWGTATVCTYHEDHA